MYARICAVALLLASVSAHGADTKVAYPPMPEAFSSFGAAVVDGHVYVYGGHVAKTHDYSTEAVTGKFRRLDLSRPAAGWEELPTGLPLQGLALVAHGGKLYRIGGMQPRNKPGDPTDNFSTATSAVFDPKTKKWSALPDLPAARSSHDAVVVGDTIVVVGGWTLNGKEGKSDWADTALLLDLTKTPLKWEAVPQPFKRRALNAAVLDGKVYVVCGMSAARRTERTIDVFDPVTRKWATAPELPGPARNGFSPAACVNGGRLFVSPSNGTIYRLNEKKDGWEEVGTLDERRIVHRMVPAGADLLLVLGGATRGANLAAVEAIKPGVGKAVPQSND